MTQARYRALFAALLIGHSVLLLALPVLPAQDLPQHLAMARIIRDYDTNAQFREYYREPAGLGPYSLTHHAIAQLGRVVGIRGGLGVLLVVYAAALMLGVHALASWVTPGRGPPVRALLCAAFVWNPILAMGLLPFALAVPVLLWAVVSVLRWSTTGTRTSAVLAVAAAGLLPCVHPFAAACLVLIAIGLLIGAFRTGAPRLPFVAAIVVTSAVTAMWTLGGGSTHARGADWEEAFALAKGFEFVDYGLQLRWSSLPGLLSYAAWSLLGPYRLPDLGIIALALVAAVLGVRWHARKRPSPLVEDDGAEGDLDRMALYRSGALVFGVVAALAPFGVQVPDELTFINLRMLAVVPLLCIPALPGAWFRRRAATLLVGAIALCALGVHGWRSVQFQASASDARELMAEVEPPDVLMSLVFHGTSPSFGKQFRATHFLPMYYTVDKGGIASQFWAAYTPHLPIAYRAGMQPAQPPDWRPETFRADQLRDSDYVLFQAATGDDPQAAREGALRAERILSERTERVACRGLWCLYRIPDTVRRPVIGP